MRACRGLASAGHGCKFVFVLGDLWRGEKATGLAQADFRQSLRFIIGRKTGSFGCAGG